ncbi:MAG: hypothetical protein J6L79_03690 [Muribaculaceae bacterium]|nr:hypothetical protein [Muribaculaceae bacterium]
MNDKQARRKNRYVSTWVAIGAIILIILLIIWLTMADLWGDTDVAAAVMPYV